MSLVSNGSLDEETTPYIGIAARAGFRPETAPGSGDPAASLGDERAGDPVIGTHALDIPPHHLDAGGVARSDRGVQLVDRRLFKAKWPPLGLFGHVSPPVCWITLADHPNCHP